MSKQSNLVVVKPIHKHVWGDFTVSGALKGKDKKPIWDEDLQADGKTIAPRTVAFSGTGILLDLENEEHQKMYKLMTEEKACAPRFLPNPNGSKNATQRFTIENVIEKATTYLASRERKAEVETFITTVAKDEGALKRFALCFGLKGDVSVIKANLYQMIDSDKLRPKLAELINNIDRPMIELVNVALSEGDSANKKGLTKDGREMFFWNEIPLALGMNELIAYLKNEKNADLYAAIKEMHSRKKAAGK